MPPLVTIIAGVSIKEKPSPAGEGGPQGRMRATLRILLINGWLRLSRNSCRGEHCSPVPVCLARNYPGKCVAAVSWRATNGRPYTRNKAKIHFFDSLNPKYFGQPHSSLPHRLRAEPPRRGGQGVNASFLTVWRGLCPRESLPSQGRWPSDSDGRRGFFATRQRECFLLYSVSSPHASHAHTRPHRPNRPMPMPVSRSGRVSIPRAASNRVWGNSSPVQSRNAPVPAA